MEQDVALKPRIIQLPKICDPRGNLTFVQDCDGIPFNIKRVYWTYDVPAGESRGGHSHREAEEFVVATSGSFNVNIFDGEVWSTYILNRPYQGLYIPAGYWRTLDNFASGSVCLVMTSAAYSEDDYVRDYEEYKRIAAAGKGDYE
ncbi:MAG: FdtA/QdtA family cupin domain-containing protein [Duncaniella sp.]|nr:FdtA/QdtA family cupin domain-containing protein [Duncaniella sp.]MDE6118220.1 FdtA/QdtA family cupin domain-containing protein [Duncaniella sp.]